jgi:hypothetical protein
MPHNYAERLIRDAHAAVLTISPVLGSPLKYCVSGRIQAGFLTTIFLRRTATPRSLEQTDNPWSRQEPEPPSRAIPEALYSGTASGCTSSPWIRTVITSEPNLQITGLVFTRNSSLKKGQPRTGAQAGYYGAYSCASRLVCTAQPCGMHCPALTAVNLY